MRLLRAARVPGRGGWGVWVVWVVRVRAGARRLRRVRDGGGRLSVHDTAAVLGGPSVPGPGDGVRGRHVLRGRGGDRDRGAVC